jgi:uncharacterized protein (TIGR00297 family)
MSPLLVTALISIGINLLLGLVSWRLRWLTVNGAMSAVLVGSGVLHFTGFGGWLLLMLFFLTANVLGKIARAATPPAAEGIQKKGGRRDWAQVMANGGLALSAALFYGMEGGTLALVMFGSAIAASTADTWAGEVGILSRKPPVSITSFQRVPTGLSGGISLLGTLSGLLGSLLIAIAWYGAFALDSNLSWVFLTSIITIAGFSGMIVDSLLGATLQGHYWDPERNQITEHDQRDGQRFELCRGVRWIDNDMVNFLSNAIAVLIGSGLSLIIL